MNSTTIIGSIVSHLQMRKDNKNDVSFYMEIPIENNALKVIRVSNHKTHLQTWADRYAKTLTSTNKIANRMGNNLPNVYRKKYFYSFVFEDAPTQNNTTVQNGTGIIVTEVCINVQQLSQQQAWAIIGAVENFAKNNNYNEAILGKPYTVSNYQQQNTANNNQNTNNNHPNINNQGNIQESAGEKQIVLSESEFTVFIKQLIKDTLTKLGYGI